MSSLSKVILNAAEEAAEEYKKMSGFECLHWGHESFLTTWVAHSIYKNMNRQVFVDTSLKSIYENSYHDYEKDFSDKIVNYRPDVVVWGSGKKENLITAIVEVKTQPWSGGIYKDAKKALEYMDELEDLTSVFLLTCCAFDSKGDSNDESSDESSDAAIRWRKRMDEDVAKSKKYVWLEALRAFDKDKKVKIRHKKWVMWNILLFELKRKSS